MVSQLLCSNTALPPSQHSAVPSHTAAHSLFERSSAAPLCGRYTNEYLTGQSSELPCESEYAQYQQCLLSVLNEDLKSQLPGIDVRNPGSLDGAVQGKSSAGNSSSAQQKTST